MDKFGAYGVIEEGKLKSRQFIIPRWVYVENGSLGGDTKQYSLACLKHQKFISSNGCDECKKEE